MKPLLIRDKEFLRSLYSSASSVQAKHILAVTSDNQINTLIKFIHFLANGEIKLKKNHFEAITSGQLKLVKKHFESKASVKRLLSTERKNKLEILNKFSPIFHQLLFTLFNLLSEEK